MRVKFFFFTVSTWSDTNLTSTPSLSLLFTLRQVPWPALYSSENTSSLLSQDLAPWQSFLGCLSADICMAHSLPSLRSLLRYCLLGEVFFDCLIRHNSAPFSSPILSLSLFFLITHLCSNFLYSLLPWIHSLVSSACSVPLEAALCRRFLQVSLPLGYWLGLSKRSAGRRAEGRKRGISGYLLATCFLYAWVCFNYGGFPVGPRLLSAGTFPSSHTVLFTCLSGLEWYSSLLLLVPACFIILCWFL